MSEVTVATSSGRAMVAAAGGRLTRRIAGLQLSTVTRATRARVGISIRSRGHRGAGGIMVTILAAPVVERAEGQRRARIPGRWLPSLVRIPAQVGMRRTV